jgi:hypothetical protein
MRRFRRSEIVIISKLELLAAVYVKVFWDAIKIQLIKVRVKVKVTLHQTTKTQRRSRGIDILFL